MALWEKKKKQSKGNGSASGKGEEQIVILNRAVGIGFTEKVRFEQRLEIDAGETHADVKNKSIPDTGYS